ncbi:MAG: hypothetical protein ACREIA_18040 [Opitutaceae bacterium]
MRRLLRHLDKVLLVLGLLALFASAGVAFLRFQRLDEIAAKNPPMNIVPAPYEPQTARVPEIETVFWPDATPQSRGSEWIYDVFTPPVIYYNRQTGQFTVTPPDRNAPVVVRNEGDFAVELVAVRQEPYRIQLVGYVGAEEANGAPIAALENVETGDSLVGRAGKVFEQEQFTLQSFDIRRVTTNTDDSMPVIENIGFAVVLDQRTGREETLTNRERKMLPRLQAVLRLLTDPPEQRVVREGETITVEGYEYLVTQLSLNPAQAVISRRAPDAIGTSDTRTLNPVAESAASPFERVSRPSDIFSFPSR